MKYNRDGRKSLVRLEKAFSWSFSRVFPMLNDREEKCLGILYVHTIVFIINGLLLR